MTWRSGKRSGAASVSLIVAAAALAGCGGGAAPSDVAGSSASPPVVTGSSSERPAALAATTPNSPAPESAGRMSVGRRDPIRRRVAAMTLRNKVRQLIVTSFGGTAAPTRLIRRVHPGGLIYFSGNLVDRDQIRAMSQRAQRVSRRTGEPLLIMTDQEGGIVTRIPGTQGTPGGADFGGDAAWARRTAVRTGRLMHRLRINVDLAPVADVNTVGSAGVIGPRSFSSDPHVAARLVRAQVCGYHRGGVAATAKHFPGHGSTTTDSHLRTATITESARKWRHVDKVPFVSAVRSSVDLVLVGHLAFPAMDPTGRPATISAPLTRGLLRSRLGFPGVVITDSLTMGGITSWGSPGRIAVRAVAAGVDMLLMSPSPVQAIHALVAAVRRGRLTRARIDTSVERILRLKQRLGLYRAPAALPAC